MASGVINTSEIQGLTPKQGFLANQAKTESFNVPHADQHNFGNGVGFTSEHVDEDENFFGSTIAEKNTETQFEAFGES